MGNGQSRNVDHWRTPTHADLVFADFGIIWNILGMLENEEIQRSRRVNKTMNLIACKILSRRKNGAARFYGPKAIADFVDRMDTRLEETIPYSAFIFDLATIPVSQVERFGTNFGEEVRKVTLNLDFEFEPPSPTTWSSFLSRLTDFTPPDHLTIAKAKAKAVSLLTLTPNLEELRLHFKDREENVLTLNHLARLPIFPKLKILEICDLEDRCPFTTVNLMTSFPPAVLDQHQSHSTFLTAVMQKAPSLDKIKISRVDRYLSPILHHIPTLFSEINRTPPALTLDLHFMLTYDTTLYSYSSHRDFMNELTDQGYNQLHELSVTILYPTVELMAQFWAFIHLQAQNLQKLQLYFVFLLPSHYPGNLIQFPAMPNLTSLDVCAYDCDSGLSPIPPITVNPALFPKLGPLRTENKTGCLPYFSGSSIRAHIRIISSNSNSTNLKP